jgi:hypothetical protein
MSLKSFVTTLLLLGSSTAALAQPAFSANAQVGVSAGYRYGNQGDFSNRRTNDWQWIRDHRVPFRPAVYQPQVTQDPCATPSGGITLATSARTSDDFQHRVFLNTEGAPAVRSLTIEANGPMYLGEIGVEYWSGGRLQSVGVWPKMGLDGRSPSYSYDLGSYVNVHRIIVYGRNGAGSTFNVVGA